MDWNRDLPSWPLHEISQRISCPPHDWHVQITGSGPEILLLHGAGASTHSWRHVIPLLADRFRVIALDLPGHAFTRLGARHRSGIPAMSEDIAALCKQEGWAPCGLVGHSAGGALSLKLTHHLDPDFVVAINPALANFDGAAGVVFPALARAASMTPFFSTTFSAISGRPNQIRRLLASTGSRFDQESIALYARLASDRDHVNGVLRMMAQWDMKTITKQFGTFTTPTLFLVGDKDGTVPPAVSDKAAAKMPNTDVQHHAGFGHLLQEEAPDVAANAILSFADRAGRAAV
ncbi:MAG: alpha/beta fold hydrolase [Rhodobacteraceae bacterium]|nr:alpha/beta fold hydrolase [Paracoccaceae bacterium]